MCLPALPAHAQSNWGDALSFDGVDDYVSVPLILPETGTIEMWYYVGPYDVNRTVFDNSADANDWEMWVYTSGSLSFRINRNELITHRPNYTLDGPNRWYHFAVTWQRNGTQVDSALYVDGILRSSVANQTWATPGSYFYVAGGNPGNTKGNGQVDEVRIWNVARSAAEILADMKQRLTGTEAGLVAYWRLDEGAGTTTADTTGLGNTATLVNGPAWVTSTVPIGQPVLSNSSVAENQPTGTTVGTFSATDPDNTRTFAFALVSGTGDTDNGSFAISGSTLQTAASFDYETKSSYSIRVRATDQGDSSVQEMNFTITVTDVNEGGPTDIRLSRSSVTNNEPAGTTVGLLTAADPDSGDTHSFALVTGAGDTDNASFAISGNTLQTAVNLGDEGPDRYRIRVRATDQGGLTREKQLTITRLQVALAFFPFTKVIRGADPEGGELTVTYSGFPLGATVTPPSGTTAPSPLDLTVNWTPAVGDICTSHPTTVTFTDSQGVQTTNSFIIIVPSSTWSVFFDYVRTWTKAGSYTFFATADGQPVPTLYPIVFTLSR